MATPGCSEHVLSSNLASSHSVTDNTRDMMVENGNVVQSRLFSMCYLSEGYAAGMCCDKRHRFDPRKRQSQASSHCYTSTIMGEEVVEADIALFIPSEVGLVPEGGCSGNQWL